jgi:dTDP-4-dehydrorhamnose reductase
LKIALLGSAGMLGSKTQEVFNRSGHELLTPLRNDLDLSRGDQIENFFKSNSFEVLVNCTGFTKVDACEEKKNVSTALTVNGTAVGTLARCCKTSGCVLVHFSTDYVFDGTKREPYRETDKTSPINVYGQTKLEGEKLIQFEKPFFYLIRTSWVFGPHGSNFVKTIAGLLKTKPKIEVVTDQVGGPTYTGDLAEFILEMLDQKAPSGLYHFANDGYTSWNGFAQEIKAIMGIFSCEITPVLSEKFVRPAKRPSNSRFDLSKSTQAVGHRPRSWQESLKEYLTKELK